MASFLARIFSGSQKQSLELAPVSLERKAFDHAYDQLVEHIAQNMGHGWIGDEKNRLGGVAEYVCAENAATTLVALLTNYQSKTNYNPWEFYAGFGLSPDIATKERLVKMTEMADLALTVLQNADHPEHARIVKFVEECQRTDIAMNDAKHSAVRGYFGCNPL